MPTYIRGPSSKPQGRAHRARLRELLAPDLQPGARLPKALYLGAVLGIDASQAGRHLRRVLAEEGVRTAAPRGRRNGIYVTSMPEGRP
jgi:hypothetical protein